jgi:hypothetical protein
MTDEFMLPVRPGVAMIALKSKVPLLPCYIEGSPYGGTAWSPFFDAWSREGEPMATRSISLEYLGREHEEGVLEELTLRAVKALAVNSRESRSSSPNWLAKSGSRRRSNSMLISLKLKEKQSQSDKAAE